MLRERGEDDALQAVAATRQGTMGDLTADLALKAAALGSDGKVPLADASIDAVADYHAAVVWT